MRGQIIMRVVALVRLAEVCRERQRVDPDQSAAAVGAAPQPPATGGAEQAVGQSLVEWLAGTTADNTVLVRLRAHDGGVISHGRVPGVFG